MQSRIMPMSMPIFVGLIGGASELVLSGCGPKTEPAEPAPVAEHGAPVVIAPVENTPEVSGNECPESLVESIENDMITIVTRVYFNPGSSAIKPESKEILDMVVNTMFLCPQIQHLHIPGHADVTEDEPVSLSMDRSRVVEAYLVLEGVEPSRLSTAGYGSHCPVDTMTDEGALQKNRYVDFTVLETTSGCTRKWFVCNEAVAAGLVPEEVKKYLPGSDYCHSWP